MTIRATHELHERRKGRNVGVALLLGGFAAILFGLSVVKVSEHGPVQGFDHVVRPEMVPAPASSPAPAGAGFQGGN
ncbi:MAG: hypothetical protein AAF646_07660 [Pseudomonadota bacterium]